ncbi:hypothetical protein NE237_030457 [Protea cynaroides]|uniref:Isochorismatase-like domain-containing protein n=1 Tax=Protea cynaroides TaxID=273540 RepID=A0A9Q0GU96_9MAGN|nr:hypothetical protein NE237_030457 [Protea cynaroides]
MVIPILQTINTTIDLYRNLSIPIIFTREFWNDNLIINGTPEVELMPELNCKNGDKVLEKNTYGAFTRDWIGRIFGGERVKGGYYHRVIFLSTDATATSERELHVVRIKNMAYGFAYLVDCKRLEMGFSKKRVSLRSDE